VAREAKSFSLICGESCMLQRKIRSSSYLDIKTLQSRTLHGVSGAKC
jgi:hypothetical protein